MQHCLKQQWCACATVLWIRRRPWKTQWCCWYMSKTTLDGNVKKFCFEAFALTCWYAGNRPVIYLSFSLFKHISCLLTFGKRPQVSLPVLQRFLWANFPPSKVPTTSKCFTLFVSHCVCGPWLPWVGTVCLSLYLNWSVAKQLGTFYIIGAKS